MWGGGEEKEQNITAMLIVGRYILLFENLAALKHKSQKDLPAMLCISKYCIFTRKGSICFV